MFLDEYLKSKYNVEGVDMLFKFTELSPNEKFECNYGCGKVLKLCDGLFVVDRVYKSIHLYCPKCANFINELYHSKNDEQTDIFTNNNKL